MMALATSVVPWIANPTSSMANPASSSVRRMPSSAATDGSRGVVRHLPMRNLPVCVSSSTKSVNVPLISNPRR